MTGPLPAAGRYVLTPSDLAGLRPLLRRYQRRRAIPSAACWRPWRRGTILADELFAVRLNRPFTVDTRSGARHGGPGDYLTVSGAGTAATVPAARFTDAYRPVDPAAGGEELVAWACRLAAGLLGPLGEHWRHTVAVARHAEQLSPLLAAPDRPILLAAAFLHDIGYAPVLAAAGFHPYDGAVAVDQVGLPRLAALIAHHSSADHEAHLRGLTARLATFGRDVSAVADLLTYCDLTSGPTGQRTTVNERIREVQRRYGPEHVAARGITAAAPDLQDIADRVERLILTGQSERAVSSPAGQSASPASVNVAHALAPEDIVAGLRAFGLSLREVGQTVGGQSRAHVLDWPKGRRPVGPTYYPRLTAARDIVTAVAARVGDAAVGQWLRATNPSLGGRTPLTALADGDVAAAWAAATAVAAVLPLASSTRQPDGAVVQACDHAKAEPLGRVVAAEMTTVGRGDESCYRLTLRDECGRPVTTVTGPDRTGDEQRTVLCRVLVDGGFPAEVAVLALTHSRLSLLRDHRGSTQILHAVHRREQEQDERHRPTVPLPAPQRQSEPFGPPRSVRYGGDRP